MQCSLLFPETWLDSATYSETAVSRSLHCLASFLIKLSESVWLYLERVTCCLNSHLLRPDIAFEISLQMCPCRYDSLWQNSNSDGIGFLNDVWITVINTGCHFMYWLGMNWDLCSWELRWEHILPGFRCYGMSYRNIRSQVIALPFKSLGSGRLFLMLAKKAFICWTMCYKQSYFEIWLQF